MNIAIRTVIVIVPLGIAGGCLGELFGIFGIILAGGLGWGVARATAPWIFGE